MEVNENGFSDSGSNQEGAGQATKNSEIENQADFEIPDEYKDKGWARFFEGKTGDELKNELFRSYDNSQSLIGKKVEEYIKSTDLKNLDNYEEIKSELEKQIGSTVEIPDNAQGYDFNEILKDKDGNLLFEYPKDALEFFGNEFKEIGLTKEQGQKILEKYTAYEISEFEKHTNADDLENDIKKMFNETGPDKSKQRLTVESLLKEILPKESKEFLQNTAPNETIEMFYQLAKGLVDKYGFEESTRNSSNPSKNIRTDADKDTEYNRLIKQLEEIDNKPNQKAGERDEIIKQIREIFN